MVIRGPGTQQVTLGQASTVPVETTQPVHDTLRRPRGRRVSAAAPPFRIQATSVEIPPFQQLVSPRKGRVTANHNQTIVSPLLDKTVRIAG